jgi:hypothetical protein
MASECCGRERASSFCPDCGKRLDADPLRTLADHLRKQAAFYAKKASARRSLAGSEADAGHADWLRRSADRADAVHAKWSGWLRAVEEAAARLDAPPPPDAQ